jgi:hypothetical protein
MTPNQKKLKTFSTKTDEAYQPFSKALSDTSENQISKTSKP